ncbi:MAG: hypothetical protein KJ645_11205, partial [Planctomycetes bacterium]|nr:hypothetical protein [Planctomycetota bacterium]
MNSPENGPGTPLDQNPPQDDVLSQAFFRDKNVADELQGPADRWRVIFLRSARFLVPVILALLVVDIGIRKAFPPDKL